MIFQKFSDDKLVCYFMKYLKGNYQDGKTYFMENPYKNLDALINNDEDALINYVSNYLTKWYKAHSYHEPIKEEFLKQLQECNTLEDVLRLSKKVVPFLKR